MGKSIKGFGKLLSLGCWLLLSQVSYSEIAHSATKSCATILSKVRANQINVPAGQRAEVNGPLLFAQHIQGGEFYSRIQKYIGLAHQAFDLVVFRGALDSGAEALRPAEFSSNLPTSKRVLQGHQSTSITWKKAWSMLGKLYESFSIQGPERKQLVEIVRKQDDSATEQNSVTHFLLSVGGALGQNAKATAHLQVQVSETLRQRLHVEEQWKNDIYLKRQEAERVGEVGRWFLDRFEFSNESEFPNRKELFRTLQLNLFQKMFSWAAHDAKLDRIVFQVNEQVRYVLLQLKVLKEDEVRVHEVYSEFKDGKVKEYVFEMNHQEILNAEKRMISQLLIPQLKKFGASNDLSGGKMILRFSRNEFSVLKSLGILQESQSQVPYGNRPLEESQLQGPLRYAHDFANTLLSPSVLNVLSRDYPQPATLSPEFFENQRVNIHTAWPLPPLPQPGKSIPIDQPIFLIHSGDLNGREFLALHLSQQAAQTLTQQLLNYLQQR